jgi:Transposase DDE domain
VGSRVPRGAFERLEPYAGELACTVLRGLGRSNALRLPGGLEVTDAGFDYSILSEFRTRLVAGSAERQLLDALLTHCTARKLLRARGRQRTDATHVLAAIRVLNRLECVGEAMRHALNTLAVVAPTWVQAHVPPAWVDRYASRMESYRLPSGQADRQALARAMGADGYWLLEALWASATPAWLRSVEAVEGLRQIWLQQFVIDNGQVGWRDGDDLPPASRRINSPYDREARYGTKRSTTWIGAKVHLTETCDADTPHLVTQVETTLATGADYDTLPVVQRDLARRGLAPAEQLVDAGYVTAEHLVSSAQQGIDLVGPASENQNWQGRAGQGFALDHFVIDWAARRATCPGGHQSVKWKASHSQHQQPVIHVEFARADCAACPVRAHCTRAPVNPRGLTLRPQAQYEALQVARARQQTDAFKVRYAARAGIEGTLSQAVRVFDLRQARYLGQAKTHLQHVLTAVALNVVRLADWLDSRPRIGRRTTAFERVMLAA